MLVIRVHSCTVSQNSVCVMCAAHTALRERNATESQIKRSKHEVVKRSWVESTTDRVARANDATRAQTAEVRHRSQMFTDSVLRRQDSERYVHSSLDIAAAAPPPCQRHRRRSDGEPTLACSRSRTRAHLQNAHAAHLHHVQWSLRWVGAHQPSQRSSSLSPRCIVGHDAICGAAGPRAARALTSLE